MNNLVERIVYWLQKKNISHRLFTYEEGIPPWIRVKSRDKNDYICIDFDTPSESLITIIKICSDTNAVIQEIIQEDFEILINKLETMINT